MTAIQSNPMRLLHSFLAFVRRGINLVIQGILAIAIVMIAGFIAITTAAAGLALALVAVMFRLVGRGPAPRHTEETASADDGVITLEARQTPRGWTVE